MLIYLVDEKYPGLINIGLGIRIILQYNIINLNLFVASIRKMNCPNCQMAYNKNRKPMVLTCGHTFCQNCLGEQQNPRCRRCKNKSKAAINFAIYQQFTKQNLKNIDKYIKICLFGNMDVGKSSILRRLVDNQFQYNMHPTIGIDFKYVDKQIEGRTCRFQIWDSAGQERYRAVSSNHLKGSNIVILVYDVSSGAQQNGLTYWIGEIENYTNHNNVIVVGNKIDLLQEQNVQASSKKIKKPLLTAEQNSIQKLGWSHIKVSCLSSENVDKLWELLISKSKITKGVTAQQRQKSIFITQEAGMKSQLKKSKTNNRPTTKSDSKCC